MNERKKSPCYLCYEDSDSVISYHSACLKKLFNSTSLPEVTFSSNDIATMALEYVKEKRGLTGVQKKLSLSLEKVKENGATSSRLTIIGALGGEYILKPPTPDYPQMPEIEDVTMHLADIANIIVPPHGLIPMKDGELAYIIKRFDRKKNKKMAVEDLCQLSLKMTEDKYKSSHESVGKIIRKYSTNPGEDVLKFFELILFSFIVGNADMHLKNFSLTYDDTRVAFSPCYDLLSTKLLIPAHIDPEELALPLNGKKSNIRRKDFLAFSENLSIPDKVANYAISSMINHFPAWEAKINKSFLSDSYKTEFMKLILKNSEHFHQ